MSAPRVVQADERFVVDTTESLLELIIVPGSDDESFDEPTVACGPKAQVGRRLRGHDARLCLETCRRTAVRSDRSAWRVAGAAHSKCVTLSA